MTKQGTTSAAEREADEMRPVAKAAVDAARTLIEGWPELAYARVRVAIVHSLYYALARARGMKEPAPEDVFAVYGGPSFTTALRTLRKLPLARVTPDQFGAAHEALSGYRSDGGKLVESEERRRGGVHFTPPSMVRPIVARTLQPIFRAKLHKSVLDYRVCDPAVGAGAFLLELVRQLAPKVRRAKLAKDEHEAKRLAAIHCAYGVDVCPFATETARLALRLECRADAMPWAWLDDNIKHGDALVGLTDEQLRAFHWKTTGKVEPDMARVVDAAIKKGREARKARLRDLSERARSS